MQPPTSESNQTPQQPGTTLYQRAKATTAQVSNHSRVQRIAAALNLPAPWLLGLSAAAVLIACSCCSLSGLMGLASAINPPASAHVTATSNAPASAAVTATPAVTPRPAASPTARPQATATSKPSGPQPVDAAALGGTENNFVQVVGTPTYNFKDSRTYEGSVGQYTFTIGASLTDGAGGKRFWSLIITPLDSSVTWDSATANTIAKMLIPADAQYVKDKQAPDFGLEHIYVSKSLAASFPDPGSGLFTDVDSNTPVTPGTLYVACDNVNSVRGGCTIQTGQ